MHWTEIVDRHAGGAIVIDVRGHLTLAEEDASLFQHVRRLVDDGARRVVVNLLQVSYIDSVGIGEIVRSHTLMTARGGSLSLCHVGPRVREVLAATNLDDVLQIFESESDAIAPG